MDEVANCFVTPASTEAGAAYGSALMASRPVPGLRDKARGLSAYLGPSYSDGEIEALLREFKIGYRVLSDDDLFAHIADQLAQGKIVGWFQGRMEIGARALGNRSILANPAYPEMKDKINREVKHREHFRPFAPAIMAEHAERYFALRPGQRYEPFHSWMLMASSLETAEQSNVQAVVHVDGSIRPQIVSTTSNPRFHALLSAFHARSGTPMLLNTSFNVRGEPIICRPEEAIRCFYSTGLDSLAMGNIVLEK